MIGLTMKIDFCGQTPKDFNFPDSTEDTVEVNSGFERLAVCDGASESFDSQTWAKLIAAHFVIHPQINRAWLEELINRYNSIHNPSLLSWSKQAAFERGSFSTLLGVEAFNEIGTVDILSIGDSLAVMLSGDEFIDSFPYKDAEDFTKRPMLLCTNLNQNSFIDDSTFFSEHLKTWETKNISNPRLLCMTDALGEWALKMASQGDPQWQVLLSIQSETDLHNLVSNEREKKRMRIDDVTLVCISFDQDRSSELPHT